MEREGDSATNCNWYTRNNPQSISKRTGRLGNKRSSKDHPDYSIVKISQNIKKSPKRHEETCCHSNSRGKLSANAGVKNYHRSKIIIIIDKT